MDRIIMYPQNDYRDYLQHHGILGMKWGVRRYQNSDGSLTNAGRARYGNGKQQTRKVFADRNPNADVHHYKNLDTKDEFSNSKRKLKGLQALKNGPEAYKDEAEYVKAVAKDCLAFDCGPRDYMPVDEIRKRANSAAQLGIKALSKMDPHMIDSSNDIEHPDASFKEWFIYEDQTIGMGMIADLVNQGYSAKDCSKLIDVASKYNYYDDKYDARAEGMIFDITEGYPDRLKEFARHCESVKKSESADGSQRRFKNSPEIREAMRIAKADGWDALTKSQKELLNELD